MDRIGDDVGDVLIDQRVHSLPAMPFYAYQPGAAQHPQMLGDQRLAHPEALDELVHEPALLGQLGHDGQPGRSGQHFQQFARRLVRPGLR